MIERIARLRGRRPLIVEVPILSPRLSSYWLHLVTPVRASVARPLVEGLRNPTVARETRIRELLAGELARFADAAPRRRGPPHPARRARDAHPRAAAGRAGPVRGRRARRPRRRTLNVPPR